MGTATPSSPVDSPTASCRRLTARILCPVGGDLSYSAAVNPRNHARCLPGAYVVDAVDIDLAGVFTTTPPVGAYRGAGRPEGTFVLERLVDEAARALGIDPIELRRRNAIPAGKFPFTTLTGQSYDSGDYGLLLDELVKVDRLRRAASARQRAPRARRGRRPRRRRSTSSPPRSAGRAAPCASSDRARSRASPARARTARGTRRRSRRSSPTTSASTPSASRSATATPLGAPQAIGTSGSRSTALAGSALAIAATQVREKGKRIAAAILEAAPEDIVPVTGGFHVRGSRDRFAPWPAVAEVAYRWGVPPPGVELGLEATHFFKPEGEVWSAGAVLAVICASIARRARSSPSGSCGSTTPGTIVNPLLADAQLEGSLAQAWGGIMFEAIAFDADGHLLTGTLMDYAIPRADNVPHAEIHHTHTPSPRNVLGVKGLGEAGNIGVPPAVVNALVDALAPFGVRHLDMPLTPENSPRNRPARAACHCGRHRHHGRHRCIRAGAPCRPDEPASGAAPGVGNQQETRFRDVRADGAGSAER